MFTKLFKRRLLPRAHRPQLFAKLFKRRLLPPAHRPPLARDERVLAWALTTAGSPVIATNRGLWCDGRHTPWNVISKATWDGDVLTVVSSRTLVERSGYAVIEDLAPLRLELTDPEHLPHQVRLRVTSSVVQPSHHGLPGGGGVWIAARRVPGADGLAWIARYDAETDPDDPSVVAGTDALIAETHWRTVGPGE